MTVINTNSAALLARAYGQKANKKMLEPMERLSSGLRINSASDDAAGLSVSKKMTAAIKDYDMSIRNSTDMISLLSTAESALAEIGAIQTRLQELAVQSANGIYAQQDRDSMELELYELVAEVDRIAKNTSFNGMSLLDGNFSLSGNGARDLIGVDLGEFSTGTVGRYWETASFENSAFDETTVTNVSALVNQIPGWEIHNERVALGQNTASANIYTLDGSQIDTDVGAASAGDKFKVTFDTGGAQIDIVATVGVGSYSITSLVADLNTANAALGSPAGLTFVSAAGRIQARYTGAELGVNSKVTGVLQFDAGGDGSFTASGTSSQTAVGIAAGAGTSTIGGFNTPIDSSPSPLSSPGDDNTPTNLGSLNNAGHTGFDASNGYLELKHTSNITVANGFDIVHGPYVISQTAKAFSAGDLVKFDWKAAGTPGGDAFSIYAYLLNTADGSTIELLNETSNSTAATPWVTKSTTVSAAGNYKYVFVSGTYDKTGGLIAGADMFIDNIVIERNRLPAALQHLMSQMSVLSVAEAVNASDVLAYSQEQTSTKRAQLGAIINRYLTSIDGALSKGQDMRKARSRVRDADFAIETSRLAKQQILAQASMAMLAQANASKNAVLELLK